MGNRAGDRVAGGFKLRWRTRGGGGERAQGGEWANAGLRHPGGRVQARRPTRRGDLPVGRCGFRGLGVGSSGGGGRGARRQAQTLQNGAGGIG